MYGTKIKKCIHECCVLKHFYTKTLAVNPARHISLLQLETNLITLKEWQTNFLIEQFQYSVSDLVEGIPLCLWIIQKQWLTVRLTQLTFFILVQLRVSVVFDHQKRTKYVITPKETIVVVFDGQWAICFWTASLEHDTENVIHKGNKQYSITNTTIQAMYV
jgi:hypothetical protein